MTYLTNCVVYENVCNNYTFMSKFGSFEELVVGMSLCTCELIVLFILHACSSKEPNLDIKV